jgi:hypothetical protein
MRVPTDSEYLSFDGMHCRLLWKELSQEWRCPSCSRTKRELMRWGRRCGSNARIYGPIGWMIALHRHHDHGQRWHREVIICGGCNTADGTAKRELRLPDDWSFTAEEIGRFVTASPNGGMSHIDLNIAKAIYDAWCQE